MIWLAERAFLPGVPTATLPRRRARTSSPMPAETPISIALELRSDGDRVVGRLRDRHGSEWPFSSWLGLLTLIERLRASAASPTDKPANEEAP